MGDGLPNDHLSLDMGGAGGISITFLAKRRGPAIELEPGRMSFQYEPGFGSELIGPYERLIHDAMRGDHTLFTTAAGIEELWDKAHQLVNDPPPVRAYAPGSWGPNAIHQMIAPHAWRLPFERGWRRPNSSAE